MTATGQATPTSIIHQEGTAHEQMNRDVDEHDSRLVRGCVSARGPSGRQAPRLSALPLRTGGWSDLSKAGEAQISIAITAGIRCFIQIGVNLAHPTRFERVTFAFGGQGLGYYLCLPEIPWNYLPSGISPK